MTAIKNLQYLTFWNVHLCFARVVFSTSPAQTTTIWGWLKSRASGWSLGRFEDGKPLGSQRLNLTGGESVYTKVRFGHELCLTHPQSLIGDCFLFLDFFFSMQSTCEKSWDSVWTWFHQFQRCKAVNLKSINLKHSEWWKSSPFLEGHEEIVKGFVKGLCNKSQDVARVGLQLMKDPGAGVLFHKGYPGGIFTYVQMDEHGPFMDDFHWFPY